VLEHVIECSVVRPWNFLEVVILYCRCLISGNRLTLCHFFKHSESAWALSNIPSGPAEHTRVVINAQAVREFIKNLCSVVLDVRE